LITIRDKVVFEGTRFSGIEMLGLSKNFRLMLKRTEYVMIPHSNLGILSFAYSNAVKLPTKNPAARKCFVDNRKKANEMLPKENTLSVEMSGNFSCLNSK
jgi:hypothetical protein